MVARKQRIQFCDLSKLEAKDQEMAERAKVNGQVINLFKVLLNHPRLVRNWGRFGNYILQGSTLSAREREIAILAAGGCSTKDIAERVYLSARTVENHLYRAYVKLGVTDRAGLAAALGTAESPSPSSAGV